MSDLLIEIQDAIIAGDFIRAKEILGTFGNEAARYALSAIIELADEQQEMGF